MSPNNVEQKRRQRRRLYYRLKSDQPLREMPPVQWIAVGESKAEFEQRLQEVQKILARMYANSKKRGRPGRAEGEEEYAA